MTTAPFTPAELHAALGDKLALSWVAGRGGGDRPIRFRPGGDPAASSLIGHLNFIHTHRIQTIGATELQYLENLDPVFREEAIGMLFSANTDAIIVADGVTPPDDIVARADASDIPLFTTPWPTHEVINHLQYFYAHHYSERVTLHGVYLEVMGIGVLITGDPAIGKSELALELVNRGHRLIADDSPEFARVAPDLIAGSCPPILKDFLEVRGLGILNIRAMFGDNALKDTKYLRLIIRLAQFSDEELAGIDRLAGERRSRDILGVPVPEVTVPVAPGRNLAVLVEAAARNHILLMSGYDAGADFIARQRGHIEGRRT